MSYKILVVDDEVDIRNLFSLFLKKEGYEVIAAANGNEACDLISESRPDLIISDVRMPVCDGVELLNRVTKMAPPHLPILFVSGFTNCDESVFRDSPNFAGFISKPVRRQNLIDWVKKILP